MPITPFKTVFAEGNEINVIFKYKDELKELVEIAKKYRINAVISTIAGIYNSDIAKFYWKLGVERIILPRDLSVDDIERIVTSVPDVEYEAFMMRNGCTFSDSNCLGLHRSEKSAICAK